MLSLELKPRTPIALGSNLRQLLISLTTYFNQKEKYANTISKWSQLLDYFNTQ